MLKDDEIAGEGNSYTAEFWQYDSRLGKRWNQDPVVKHWMSPYHAFSDNPISNIDPNGDSDRKYEDYETGEVLGEIDDGVDETVKVTKSDFFELKRLQEEDLSNKKTELPSYNEMIERFSIGKKGYDIAQTALKYQGSLEWVYGAKKGNFGKNTYKCNKFVQDVLTENDAEPSGTWPPLASRWAKGNVEGFKDVTDGKPNVGDVIAGAYSYSDASGHVVIVTYIDLLTGYVETMGTVHSNYIGDGGFGDNLINNGGVHDGKKYTVGVKRYIGN